MAEAEKTFLRFLLEASPQQVKAILVKITPSQLDALGEVCYNLLYGTLEPDILSALKKFHRVIRQLADKSVSAKQRRQIAVNRHKQVVHILRQAEKLLP